MVGLIQNELQIIINILDFLERELKTDTERCNAVFLDTSQPI